MIQKNLVPFLGCVNKSKQNKSNNYIISKSVECERGHKHNFTNYSQVWFIKHDEQHDKHQQHNEHLKQHHKHQEHKEHQTQWAYVTIH